MTTYAALLRAVNLGAHNKVAMADLVDLCGTLGLRNARSLLQSGNLVFDCPGEPPAALEDRLQAAARKRLNLDTDFFLRTANDWQGLIANNPFSAQAKSDPGHLVVMCLKRSPRVAEVAALTGAIAGREQVRVHDRHAYIVYPDGIGRSKVTIALVEKKLGTRGTGRNWNTVLKLGGLVGA